MLESSILITILSGGLGLGGVAGYLTRRLQKLEERTDNTNLKVLPAIYYNTYYFIESARIFNSSGSLAQFIEKIKDINKNLKILVSSGDIIPSDTQSRELFSKVLEFHQGVEVLEDFLIRNSPEPNPQNSENEIEEGKRSNIEDLRSSFNGGAAKRSIAADLKEYSADARALNLIIEEKLKGYKSISLRLMLLIAGTGATIAIIQLVTSAIPQ
jgi:lipopolysaccharide export LptBFGC system permease protein LptF